MPPGVELPDANKAGTSATAGGKIEVTAGGKSVGTKRKTEVDEDGYDDFGRKKTKKGEKVETSTENLTKEQRHAAALERLQESVPKITAEKDAVNDSATPATNSDAAKAPASEAEAAPAPDGTKEPEATKKSASDVYKEESCEAVKVSAGKAKSTISASLAFLAKIRGEAKAKAVPSTISASAPIIIPSASGASDSADGPTVIGVTTPYRLRIPEKVVGRVIGKQGAIISGIR